MATYRPWTQSPGPSTSRETDQDKPNKSVDLNIPKQFQEEALFLELKKVVEDMVKRKSEINGIDPQIKKLIEKANKIINKNTNAREKSLSELIKKENLTRGEKLDIISEDWPTACYKRTKLLLETRRTQYAATRVIIYKQKLHRNLKGFRLYELIALEQWKEFEKEKIAIFTKELTIAGSYKELSYTFLLRIDDDGTPASFFDILQELKDKYTQLFPNKISILTSLTGKQILDDLRKAIEIQFANTATNFDILMQNPVAQNR